MKRIFEGIKSLVNNYKRFVGYIENLNIIWIFLDVNKIYYNIIMI